MKVAADRVIASIVRLAAGLLAAVDVSTQVERAPRLERVATNGGDECFRTGDPRAFSEITDVAISANGTAWVADRAAPKLRAFRIDGTPLRAFGAHGRGPGELLSVTQLHTDGTTLIAIDMFARQMVRFDSVGTLLGTRLLDHVPMDADSPAGCADVVTLTGEFRPGTSSVHRWSPGATR